MSLIIYYNRDSVPCEIQDINDSYFDIFTPLTDTSLTREILKAIDKAEYVNSEGFSGRSQPGVWLSREYLSTGTKTLLNVLSHPNVCFNVAECGTNALKKLVTFNRGMVYWPRISLMGFTGKCDIEVDGTNFSNIMDLRRYLHDNRG